jgi:hypothetical protein
MTKIKTEKLDAIRGRLQAAFEKKDAQSAAQILADLNETPHGPDRVPLGLAMDVAADVGFIPEYYANSIRVYLPE